MAAVRFVFIDFSFTHTLFTRKNLCCDNEIRVGASLCCVSGGIVGFWYACFSVRLSNAPLHCFTDLQTISRYKGNLQQEHQTSNTNEQTKYTQLTKTTKNAIR